MRQRIRPLIHVVAACAWVIICSGCSSSSAKYTGPLPADLAAPAQDLPDLLPPDLGAVCGTDCPQACNAGMCGSGPVSCMPGSRRCFENVVQECNLVGNSWLTDSVCLDACSGGLCTGACNPGDTRCNGSNRETCNAGGTGWGSAVACPSGCDHTVCIEPDITDHGNSISLSGPHVYPGCVTVDLGGSIVVPAGQTLSIWASCLSLSASASITLGAGASFFFHASDTINTAGTISGGNQVFLSAWKSLSNTGPITSPSVTLRSDVLTNGTGGVTSGTATAALYGTSWTNLGTHTGAVSVMPPEVLYSSTHPQGLWLNLKGDVDLAWDRPFGQGTAGSAVLGYYWSVGDGVPGPGMGTFSNIEHVTVPVTSFGPGANRIRVVSVNANSTVGTYPVDFNLQFNVRPPTLSSSSHPVEDAWGGPADVYFSWTDPASIPASAWTGYYFIFDHQADTIPDAATGTLTTNRTLLLPGQAAGIWYFHLVNIDKLGRTSPLVAHYQVRIGTDPGSGNLAGHISDQASGAAIAGARVELNGGLLNASSGTTGDYTFATKVPAAALPYRVTISAPGYASAQTTVTIGAGATQVLNFMLKPTTPPTGYALGYEVQVWDQNPQSPTVAAGPRGRYIWSTIGTSFSTEKVAIVRVTGDEVVSENTYDEYYTWEQGTDVGWNGSVFWAIDTYRCGYDAAISYGSGWSALRMKTWTSSGTVSGNWLPWRNSGQTGAASAVWNGNNWGVFFVSYGNLYEKDITSSVMFGSGTNTSNTALPGDYGDTRQSGYTATAFDGNGYGLAFNMYEPPSNISALYLARYNQSLGVTLSTVKLDGSPAGAPALVYDGANYQVAYRKYDTPPVFILRTVTPAGDGSANITLVTNPSGGGSHLEVPSLAFDQRYLLVAYNNGDRGTLEARLPSDRSLVFKQDLGPMQGPRISFNAATGEGVILYSRPDKTGTFLRPFTWN